MGIGTISIIFNVYLTYHINAILKQNDRFKERNITLNDQIIKALDNEKRMKEILLLETGGIPKIESDASVYIDTGLDRKEKDDDCPW
jgi:hypothetical protein